MTKIIQSLMESPATIASLDINELRTYLLDLFCQNAYQEGEFLLSSGQRSSYYINGKQVTLHPQGCLAVGRVILAMLSNQTEAVAGLTLGADPIVTAVSVVAAYTGRSLPALIIRKEAKGHGTRAYIEGIPLPEGSLVTVLEDVVTTGKSALQATERLQAAGYQVNGVIALVDRLQGGAELYCQQGLPFEAVFSIEQIRQRWLELSA